MVMNVKKSTETHGSNVSLMHWELEFQGQFLELTDFLLNLALEIHLVVQACQMSGMGENMAIHSW